MANAREHDDSEDEEFEDDAGSAVEDVDLEEEENEGGDDDSEVLGEDDQDMDIDEGDEDIEDEAPRRGPTIIIKRSRGRGRGVASSPAPSRGRGAPRGRPRGRGRGRGRGSAPLGLTVVLKNPRSTSKDDADDGEGDSSTVRDGAGDAVPKFPVGTQYKKVLGKYYIFESDELLTEEDEKGNTKIDPLGNLLDGRVFKAPTFRSPWRPNPDKNYMLSIDAARTSGFRDSLYYFRRNPTVVKLTLTQSEKEHLIGLGRLSTNLKSRSVTMLTARSAYKCHGAKMIKDGKWVTDDYYEDKMREECIEKGITPGEPVGELPDVNIYPGGDIAQPIRTHGQLGGVGPNAVGGTSASNSFFGNSASGSSAIYRPGGPTTHFGGAGLGPFDDAHNAAAASNAARRAMLAREGVGEDNWMWKTALRVHESNEILRELRQSRLRGASLEDPHEGGMEETLRATREEESGSLADSPEEVQARKRKRIDGNAAQGVYEPHTDLFHYRADTQPTRAKLEHIMGEPTVTGEKRVGGLAWGVIWVDEVMELPPELSTGATIKSSSRESLHL